MIGTGIDERLRPGDDVRYQVAGPRSDAEAMTAEAGGEHEAGNSRRLADRGDTVRGGIDVAGPARRRVRG